MTRQFYRPGLTQTMRRALACLDDGRDPLKEPRPKGVTIRTMIALRKRGLIVYRNERWERVS